MEFELLGNICDVVRGSSPRPQGDKRYYGGKIPRLMIADVTRDKKYVTPIIDSLTEEGAAKSRPMNKGDLIIAVSGDPGRVCFLNVDACIHDGFVGLRNLDESKYDKEFLYYYLTFFKSSMKHRAYGAIFQNITTDILKGIKIPKLSISQQSHIATLASKAENLIAKRKESIRLLDEFLKSTFLEMFGDPVRNEKGWETKPLNQLVDKLGDGLHGTPVYDDNGEYFFINGNNLEKGFIRTDEKTKKVSYKEYIKHSKELNENTILVSINGTLGRVAFYRGEKIILGKSACYFNLIKDSIDSLFLFHFLQSEFFLKYVTNKATGSTISNVSLKTMRELPIILPPPSLQNQFAQIVAKTVALKNQYEQSLQELENLYGSLSQKAFNGELSHK